MSAPQTQTPEQRELALVGKVEMRVALTDTDSKLETVLKTYLAPLLLKLASEYAPVRNKVVAVCQHINKRIQPQSIQLPVLALIKQFKEQTSPLIRNFDMLYIQQGIGRLSSRERADLLPGIVAGIADSGSHAPQVFHLLLKVLDSVNLPLRGSPEDIDLRTKLEVSDADTAFLAERIGKLILFSVQKSPTITSPGLSTADQAFLTLQDKEGVWNPAMGGLRLAQIKAHAVRLLASGLFNDKERFLPALFASADPASTISDVGDDILKRALPANDLEDVSLITRLFELYFGQEGTPRVRPPLRLKILGLLNKSTISTTLAANVSRLVNDGVRSSSMDGEDIVMSNAPATNGNVGREVLKLRAAVFSYITFVARYGDKDTLLKIAREVTTRLRDFIENQGWPVPGANEDLISRGYAYEVIGLLAKGGPRDLLIEEFHPSLDLVRWLFRSLAQDSSSNAITVSIEESLSTVLNAFSRLSLAEHEQVALEQLLCDEMAASAEFDASKRIRSTRYVAVRFANRCLPYSSVQARWINCLAAGAISDRPEVREEGERGLSPYWYRMLNGANLASQSVAPTFPEIFDVVNQFFRREATIASASLSISRTRQHNGTAFPFLVAFLRRTLVHKALANGKIPVNIDSDWERSVDAIVESDAEARDVVREAFEAYVTSGEDFLDILIGALFEVALYDAGSTGEQLVECLALAPAASLRGHVNRIKDLRPILSLNNHSRRKTAARAFGILGSDVSATAIVAPELQHLLDLAQGWVASTGSAVNTAHGAITALAYYYSRLAYRRAHPPENDEFKQYVKIIFDVFRESRDDLLREASHVAIGQLSMFQGWGDSHTAQIKVRDVTDRLHDKAKAGDEVAILALGQWSMSLPEGDGSDDDELQYIADKLHLLHEIRQSEVHFAVGEAFSCLACGWQSEALATKLDIAGEKPTEPTRKITLGKLIDKVLQDCSNTKPALKKAAVMWLLCLVQFCGSLPEMQAKLSQCQTAFRRCLSDRDELVQETASRGLGLVYEKGDRALKDDLVRELVSSFSSDKQQLAGNVSSDTQLFEPGALPTGDGSVSTYKDIMSLASEVGDSSLVYKFMSMASSNAIWSSRAAFGRFGLSRVLSDSSVDGYLANNPKLYPKLYRYRFDPNGGVQRSMTEIWNALVPDSTATIDKHFDAIIEDLLVSILGKEWRVRQACCAAIADLVQGRPLEKYEKYLERIWTQCFKVLDDIKESVRAAASTLARSLTGVLTRALEADHSSTKNASAMLKHVLPFLLSPSGMESSAQDVQMFSVHTLLEIIKKANGATIRPFIPELVERLIGLLSTLEPEAVNYIHLNASKYNLTEQKIDDMRLSSVRGSPLMEAIERCLDLADDDTMRALYPKLESAAKSAVGLPSKVGASRVMVSLSTRRMVLFKPYADDALKLIEKLVNDRNETVSSSWAVAAGYVARGASDKQLLRLITYSKSLYFDSEGDRAAAVPRRALVSGELMHAFAKYASDKFAAFAASAVPFVFVGKYDSNDAVKEEFQSTWDEAVGGSRAVQLYLKEILALCIAYLDSPQWVLKHTASRAVAAAVIAVASGEVEMSTATAEAIWLPLEKALSGKTWDGKEVVLPAFVKFVAGATAHIEKNSQLSTTITKISIREAKRQNAAYRPHALKALAGIARAREQVDMSDAVFEVVEPLLQKGADDADGDAMDVDGKDGVSTRQAEELKQSTITAAIDALLSSINPTKAKGDTLKKQISRALILLTAFYSEPEVRRSVAVARAVFEGLATLFTRAAKAQSSETLAHPDMAEIHALMLKSEVDVEAIRLIRVEAIEALVKAFPATTALIEADVTALAAKEASPTIQTRLRALVASTTR